MKIVEAWVPAIGGVVVNIPLEMVELGHRAWYYEEMERRFPNRWIIFTSKSGPVPGSDASTTDPKPSKSPSE